MLNQKIAFCFKITISTREKCSNTECKWNLTKSYAAKLKSAKHKTRVIKEYLRMNEQKPGESILRLIML